jgi:hypothetical protein
MVKDVGGRFEEGNLNSSSFKCTFIFSFDIQTEIRKLKMGRAMKDASLTSFLQMVGQ